MTLSCGGLLLETTSFGPGFDPINLSVTCAIGEWVGKAGVAAKLHAAGHWRI
jgi:hypothetical protein